MADTWTTLVNRLHMHEHFEEDCPCDGCDAVREAIAIVAAAEAWAKTVAEVEQARTDYLAEVAARSETLARHERANFNALPLCAAQEKSRQAMLAMLAVIRGQTRPVEEPTC